ncbi:hypothetical protein [Xanthomonas vesicatoria]|nr:hypothetical protein [Xanthomonas vesicatoria]
MSVLRDAVPPAIRADGGALLGEAVQPMVSKTPSLQGFGAS